MDEYAGTYRFDEIEVDPSAHRVTRKGIALDLEPKAFSLLVALLQHPGKALARDDLLDTVWGHRHVTPGVLNRVVGHLRKALGDEAENPRYIQTLHGIGYRFIAEVERAPSNADSAKSEAALSPDSAETPASAQAGLVHATPDVSTLATRAASSAAPLGLRTLALASLAVILLGVAAWFVFRERVPTAPADASIAVLPFDNLSPAENAYFVDGLTEEMRAALSSVPGLKVAASITPEVRASAADAKALGAKLGVATILEASVRRDGSQLRISARLSDTTTGFTLWSETFDRPLLDVFATQTRIANEVVESLIGVIPGERDALRKRLTPTHNVEAFDDYLEGLQLLSQAEAAEHSDQAIARFDQALKKDSTFARAQAGICISEINKFESTHSSGAFDNARIACQRALNMDSSLADVSLAMGDLYRVQGQLDDALREYQSASIDPATAIGANLGLAQVHALMHQPKLVEQYFSRALAIDPNDSRIYSTMGYQAYLDGNLVKAIASLRKAVDLQPDNAETWSLLGALQMEASDNVQAQQSLQRSIAISPGYAALTNLGLLHYLTGDYPAAIAAQRQALELNPSDFMAWGNLGMALNAIPENADAAHKAYAEAASRAESYLGQRPADARATAALGLYRAILGDPREARKLLAQAEALGSVPGEVALLNAQTLALLGDIPAAQSRVQHARNEGIAESLIVGNSILRRSGLLDSSGSESSQGTSKDPPTPNSKQRGDSDDKQGKERDGQQALGRGPTSQG